MDFIFNQNCYIDFREIGKFLSKKDIFIISCLNNLCKKFFQKYKISISIYYYFHLIKNQIRRPAAPSLYTRMCGIDLITPGRYPNQIMLKYKQDRNYVKVINNAQKNLKYNHSLNNCLYDFDALLLDNVNMKYIFKIVSTSFTPKIYENFSYYIQLFNYESLGVSRPKAHMLSSFNHEFRYHNPNHVFSPINSPMNYEWYQYIEWKNENKKFRIVY